MRVLIENAVPLNNGDAALIFSVGEKFESEGVDVTYATFNYDDVVRRYPDKKWVKSKLSNKYINKLPFIRKISTFIKVILDRDLRKYDAVVSAPGGYINSYYGFEMKLYLLSLYKRIYGTKIYMYSQSVGPLNQKDALILGKYINNFNYFFVRDDISMKRVKEYLNGKIVQTKDAAFLLPILDKKNTKEKKVAFSVRNWNHDARSFDTYAIMIHRMIKIVIDKGYCVEFISTCQGYPNYEDDSLIAKRIVSTLDNDLKQKVTIDSKLYSLEELRNKISSYEFVVGTRLHMCILSWLSKVPAFNISYEEKGKECYQYLNIPQFSIDYNDTKFEDELLNFLEYNDFDQILSTVNSVHEESVKYFDLIFEDVKNG